MREDRVRATVTNADIEAIERPYKRLARAARSWQRHYYAEGMVLGGPKQNLALSNVLDALDGLGGGRR